MPEPQGLEEDKSMTKYLTKRYLTPKEKEYIFDTSTWSRVDSGLMPYLSRLNSLDGVCTIQSCIGHRRKMAGDGDYVEPGSLWIRLSEAMSEQFRQRVGLLTLCQWIRQVRTFYSFDDGMYPHEVVDISFHGAEDDSLDEALSYIACFFEGISEREISPGFNPYKDMGDGGIDRPDEAERIIRAGEALWEQVERAKETRAKDEPAFSPWGEYSESGSSGWFSTMHQRRGMPETKHVEGTWPAAECRLCEAMIFV